MTMMSSERTRSRCRDAEAWEAADFLPRIPSAKVSRSCRLWCARWVMSALLSASLIAPAFAQTAPDPGAAGVPPAATASAPAPAAVPPAASVVPPPSMEAAMGSTAPAGVTTAAQNAAAATAAGGRALNAQGNPALVVDPNEKVTLDVQNADIQDVIKQISVWTKRNFILDQKVQGKKVTILSESPMTIGEVYQAFISALNVVGLTIVEGPGGVFKVVDINEAKKYPIPTHVDTTPITDNFITRLVTLSNISAMDMQNAIGDMLSKGGSIKAYPQTNTLIITDSGANIDRLMKIMKELDQEGPQQVMEIVPVKNAKAKEIADMVNQLFEMQKQGKTKPKPGDQVDIDEVSKLIPDDRTNAIILLASKRAIEQVRAVIQRLDQKLQGGQEGHIHVYFLKYAKAKDMVGTLNSLVQGAGKKPEVAAASKEGGTTPTLAEFEGGIKLAADETVNALIITSTYSDFKTLVEKVISKLDVRRRQVYLEAVVMELSIDSDRRLGVSGHGGFGLGGALGFGQTLGALPGLSSNLLDGGPTAPALLGGLISQRTVTINALGQGGAAQQVTLPAFSAFMNALATYGNSNIISTPNLLALENEDAKIEVQQEEPIPGPQTIVSGAITTGSPTYEKAGLTLTIKPQISYGDTIALKLKQELSTFGARLTPTSPPSRKKRNVESTVLCQDGQTVVIGGLMEDQISSSKSKVPILGDIPLLGFFFSRTDKTVKKSNLLIFITPYIVRDSNDFAEILKRKIEERNDFVQQNYGKKQQETIRNLIRSHREDLLEFKGDGTPGSENAGSIGSSRSDEISRELSNNSDALSKASGGKSTKDAALPRPSKTMKAPSSVVPSSTTNLPPPVISIPPLSSSGVEFGSGGSSGAAKSSATPKSTSGAKSATPKSVSTTSSSSSKNANASTGKSTAPTWEKPVGKIEVQTINDGTTSTTAARVVPLPKPTLTLKPKSKSGAASKSETQSEY